MCVMMEDLGTYEPASFILISLFIIEQLFSVNNVIEFFYFSSSYLSKKKKSR